MAKTKKSVFRLSNTALWSFIAMVAGALLGLAFPEVMEQFKVIGDIWLKCINLIVIPLVLCIVILAIAQQEDAKSLGRVALRIAIYYAITTFFAVAIGLALSMILKPGNGVDLSGLHATKVDQTTTFTAESFISGLFTDNLFKTFTDGNLLQTMVIAILFGIALLQVKNKESRRKVIHMIESLNDMIFSYLNMIIKLTPIGVFFLIADSFGKFGFSIFTSMAGLIGTYWLSILLMTLLVYCVVLWIVARISPLQFIKDTSEVWLFTIATCSGSASIPIALKNVKEKFGVPDHIADFCITVGGQLNSHGSALLYGCVLIFISQMYDIQFSLATMIQIVLVGSLISVSGGGIPGSGIVKLSIVISTFGLPAEVVGIIAGFYRFFDMGTSTGNVLGDIAGTVTISKLEEKHAKKLGIPFE
ncbi:MAG TPA: dicarboxylate/amino acid:cation symporter [Tetragenococcus sp.]|nr:dicarboxylate/amino acid:cation symporter [Tetragenococcus sp.]